MLTPEFVDFIPPTLEPGVLYVSMEYRTTRHLCACGCGEPVVLPLHPGQWSITFDGQHVSMSPSVGNVGQPCRSHYFIRSGRIVWSYALSEHDAHVGRQRDRDAVNAIDDRTEGDADASRSSRIVRRVLRWLLRR